VIILALTSSGLPGLNRITVGGEDEEDGEGVREAAREAAREEAQEAAPEVAHEAATRPDSTAVEEGVGLA